MKTDTPTPGIPVENLAPAIPDASSNAAPTPRKERSYILYYRYAKLPSLFKVFNFSGSLQEAIIRGRQHCLKMGYIFILVLPFLVDLEDQETRKQKDPASFEDESPLSMRL